MTDHPSRNARLAAPAGDRAGGPPGETSPAPHGQYPRVRMRRNRADGWTRRMVAENRLVHR